MAFLAAAAPLFSTLGTIAGVAGTALSAISQMQQAKFQQKIAQRNADIADQNARRAIGQSQIAEKRQDAQTAAVLGDQLAAQGASGLSLENGSPLDIRESTARLGRLDTLTVRNNAEREAYNYKVQAADYNATASMAGKSATNSLVSGFINVGNSLLSSASSTAPKWDPYKMQKQSNF